MEEQKLERAPMEQEEFEKYIHENMYNDNGTLKLYLFNYSAVGKYKSIRRAIKRGHVSMTGVIYPERPFGNTRSSTNIAKRKMYEQHKFRRQVV